MSYFSSLELVRAHEAAARRRLGVRSDLAAAHLALADGGAANASSRAVIARGARAIARRLERVAGRLDRWGDLPSQARSPLAGR